MRRLCILQSKTRTVPAPGKNYKRRDAELRKSTSITVTADGKLVRVITTGGVYSAKQSLQNVGNLLNSRLFLRISRFELINLAKVRKYDFTIGGTLRVEFEGGMETWASRRYIPLIREKLAQEEGYLC